VLVLVSKGFSEEQVFQMPLDKVFLYTEGAKRLNAYRRKEDVADLVNAIGISFSGKGFKEYLQSLGADDG
jgi:hypothetical protein